MYPYCRVPRTVTGLYIYLVLNCLALCRFTLVEADVVILSPKTNYTVENFLDMPASFGQALPPYGLKGYVVGANPKNACAPIEPPPKLANYTGKWFVVIKRYDCSFIEKVRQAQKANYSAAIIHNVGSNSLEPMAGDDTDDIDISAVFIGQDDGLVILAHYQYDKGYKVVLTNELPFSINNYLLPFAIVVALCFVVMLIFMIVKCVKDRRRMRRYRLPSSTLKTIPTSKFKKGDPYDTCAICLEDYVDGDKLRLLPCSHAYHCKCIDPWLTRNRRVCPVCKRKVLAEGEHLSDSDSDSDDSETRPLLRPGSYGTQGGTFTTQQENLAAAENQEEQSTAINIGTNEDESVEAVVIESQPRESAALTDDLDPDFESVLEVADRSSTPVNQSELRTPSNVEDSNIFFTPQSSRRSDSPVDI